MVAFWSLAPIMVIAALGILFVRKAVHAALLLATVMLGLAVQYAALDAPFLFAVQIIVYTGAILMLFLFVVMLVGVDAADTWTEVIKGQRTMAVIGGLIFGSTLLIGVSQLSFATAYGLDEANGVGQEGGGNIEGLAQLMFSRYIVAFEVTSALLITAAVGAMVLAHRERITPKLGQPDLAAQRLRDFATSGVHPGNLPAPGTYARSNSVDTPALLPDGSISTVSVPAVIRALVEPEVPEEPGLDTPSSVGHSTSEGSDLTEEEEK